jgi:hypothetical protein
MNVRDVNIVTDDTQPVVAHQVRPMTSEPDMIVTEVPAHQTTQVRTSMTISPAAVVAGIASIVLLLFGAINLARAGVDGSWRDPIVEVASYEGTAILGLIALGAGIALLGAALSRDRAAILFVSIVLGIAGATVAIEPTVGGDLIATEASLGIAVLIISVFVAFVAAVAPSVRRTSNHLERS